MENNIKPRGGRWINLLALLGLLILSGYLLLNYLNVSTWAQLWPRLALITVIAILAAAIWFRRVFPSAWTVYVNNPERVLRWLRRVLLAVAILGVNLILLHYFNTLNWPYLWPRPGIFALVLLLVGAIWFREVFTSIWALRFTGIAMIFIGESYFIHSLQVTMREPSVLTVLHLVGFGGMFGTMVINYVNQIFPKITAAPSLPADLPHVAVVVPTYGEPYHILEETVLSLKRLDYPEERLCIIVSDDGHRPEIASLARLHNVHYNKGAKKDAKAGNLNSALTFLEKLCPEASLILTQDADETIDPSFLKKTVGYFNDPGVGLVQTPKEVKAPDGDPFGTRDRLFYDILQPGRNGAGAAFACGSGVIWRIEALKSIGGFVTWNVVEDLTTSYHLHSAGYRSEYHNEILSIGLAPDDIPGLLKQRGTWAVDTFRLFLFDNPLRKPGLTLRQRLQYLELGLFYTTSILFTPILMLIPLLSLVTGYFIPIEGAALFPWIGISLIYYAALSRGQAVFLLRHYQYWVGHWPTYTKAFLLAIRSRNRKPGYKVTRKTRVDGYYGYLLWAQFLYLAAGAFLVVRALVGMPDVYIGARLTNAAILVFYMVMVWGICRASFYNWNPSWGILRRVARAGLANTEF